MELEQKKIVITNLQFLKEDYYKLAKKALESGDTDTHDKLIGAASHIIDATQCIRRIRASTSS